MSRKFTCDTIRLHASSESQSNTARQRYSTSDNHINLNYVLSVRVLISFDSVMIRGLGYAGLDLPAIYLLHFLESTPVSPMVSLWPP